MTPSPALSPWPAPTPADAVPPGTRVPTLSAETAKQPGQSVEVLRRAIKRWCSPSERAEHAAAKEEERISDELTGLPAGWFVLHSNEIGERRDVVGDADHVVIGPGGVFLIHLEHHVGANVWVNDHTMSIDGRDSDHLCTAIVETRQASDRLTDACGFDVAVQSVLVLIGAATVQTLSRPAEVHVRTQYDIRDWICKQPTRLDAEMAGVLHERLRPAAAASDSAPVYAFGSSTTTGI
jgi:hypothetical protein